MAALSHFLIKKKKNDFWKRIEAAGTKIGSIGGWIFAIGWATYSPKTLSSGCSRVPHEIIDKSLLFKPQLIGIGGVSFLGPVA